MSAFMTVQAALAAALRARPELAGVNLHINRTRALPREEQRAILLRLDVSRVLEDGVLGVTDWATTFELEAAARGESGADPAEAVDALLAAVWAALPQVVVVGAIDVRADPSIDWTFEAADTPIASALLRVTVMHRTEGNTLTPKD